VHCPLTNDDFPLLVGVFQLIQVTFHGLAAPEPPGRCSRRGTSSPQSPPPRPSPALPAVPSAPTPLRPQLPRRGARDRTRQSTYNPASAVPAAHHFPVQPPAIAAGAPVAGIGTARPSADAAGIARPSRLPRLGRHQSQPFLVQLADEGFDYPAGMIASHQLVQRRSKQGPLPARPRGPSCEAFLKVLLDSDLRIGKEPLLQGFTHPCLRSRGPPTLRSGLCGPETCSHPKTREI
jgi:hypothetical protein